MINNSTIVGRLTETPELRTVGNGIEVVNFTVAVERSYSNASGEKKSDFIRCIAWRKTAEIISKIGYKGSLVGIVGAIETDRYENKEGQTVYTTEINVDEFQMLEPKSVTDERRKKDGGGTSYNLNPNTGGYNSKPANEINSTNQSNPFAGDPFQSGPADISDDDLPF